MRLCSSSRCILNCRIAFGDKIVLEQDYADYADSFDFVLIRGDISGICLGTLITLITLIFFNKRRYKRNLSWNTD